MNRLKSIFGRWTGTIWALLLVWTFAFIFWVFRDLTLITAEVNVAFASALSILVVLARFLKELSQ